MAFMRLGRIVREGRHLTQLRQVATSLQLQVSGDGCAGLCVYVCVHGKFCIVVVVVYVCMCACVWLYACVFLWLCMHVGDVV